MVTGSATQGAKADASCRIGALIAWLWKRSSAAPWSRACRLCTIVTIRHASSQSIFTRARRRKTCATCTAGIGTRAMAEERIVRRNLSGQQSMTGSPKASRRGLSRLSLVSAKLPLAGFRMKFDERWISEAQLQMTAALAMSVAELDGEFIEVGVWQGASAIPIAQAIAPATLHLVDHWLGDKPEAGELGIEKWRVERDNYGQCLENLEDSGVSNTMIWKMDWRDFIQRWNRPIKFVHIDASHTADEVADNIRDFLPHAVPGAVFCGDDYTFPQVEEGVRRHFRNPMAAERMWWSYI